VRRSEIVAASGEELRLRWFGQSAFLLSAGDGRVMIDPFDDVGALAERVRWCYPPIPVQEVDVVLVTHEHLDHHGVGVASGDPHLFRAAAGTFESSVGGVVGVASEHDDVAGTARGPNTIFVFSLDGVRICHLGDLGQEALRDAQLRAIGKIDLVLIPVGGGPTIGAQEALRAVQELDPRWVVPMHYRTPAVDFLESPDEFLSAFPAERVHRFEEPEFGLPGEAPGDDPQVLVPGAPGA
jgi:L-ascorbate metabolism protein UlaG (beta-lactamase superfamily)